MPSNDRRAPQEGEDPGQEEPDPRAHEESPAGADLLEAGGLGHRGGDGTLPRSPWNPRDSRPRPAPRHRLGPRLEGLEAPAFRLGLGRPRAPRRPRGRLPALPAEKNRRHEYPIVVAASRARGRARPVALRVKAGDVFVTDAVSNASFVLAVEPVNAKDAA